MIRAHSESVHALVCMGLSVHSLLALARLVTTYLISCRMRQQLYAQACGGGGWGREGRSPEPV